MGKRRLVGAVALLAALVVCGAAGCGSGTGTSLDRVVGTYANASDPDDQLKVYPKGEWAFFYRGSTPRFVSSYTNKWVEADDNFMMPGPVGEWRSSLAGGLNILELAVTKDADETDLRSLMAQFGCPDVSNIKYRGVFRSAVGCTLTAKVVPQADAMTLLISANGGGDATYRRVGDAIQD